MTTFDSEFDYLFESLLEPQDVRSMTAALDDVVILAGRKMMTNQKLPKKPIGKYKEAPKKSG